MSPLLEQFISESRDLLEEAAKGLLSLENSPNDMALVNQVFRAAHTIKGSTGLFDFVAMGRVVHAAEDLLDAAKAGSLDLNSDIIDLLLEAFDQVGAWVDHVELHESLPADAMQIGQELANKLRASFSDKLFLDVDDTSKQVKDQGWGVWETETMQSSEQANQQSGWGVWSEQLKEAESAAHLSEYVLSALDQFETSKLIELYRKMRETEHKIWLIDYLPSEDCFFKGEDPLFLVKTLPGNQTTHIQLMSDWDKNVADIYSCNLRFIVLSDADHAEIQEHLRYVLDQTNLYELKSAQLIRLKGKILADQDMLDEFISQAKNDLEYCKYRDLQNAARAMLEITNPQLLTSCGIKWLDVLLDYNVEPVEIKALLAAIEQQKPLDWSLVSVQQELSKNTVQDLETISLDLNLKSSDVVTFSEEALALIQTQADLFNYPIDEQLRLGRIKSVGRVIENILVAEKQKSLLALWLEHIDSAQTSLLFEGLKTFLQEITQAQPVEEVVSTPEEFDAFLKIQLQALSIVGDASLNLGRIRSAVFVLNRAAAHSGQIDRLVGLEEVEEQALVQKSLDVLARWIRTRLLASPDDNPKVDSASPKTDNSLTKTKNDEALIEKQPTATSESQNVAKVFLKVDQANIERLGDLIGEMVVAKNTLPYLAQKAENDFGIRELARLIKDQFNVIDRITQELQQGIMQVQMLPVSNIFQRTPRLVRDISRKLNKKVHLVLEGEETEVDKTIIESLADPMVHIVRNSLDHGIELPEVRLAKGKPEVGILKLKAWQEGEGIIIEVSDDGKGIDPEIIKRKAYQKGLIDEDKLDNISDQEAINLIFAPGFSTNDEVSDLSGRGVGMDVVRTSIEAVGGNIQLESQVDKGSSIRLSLPLSMAISNVMQVMINKQSFGVPMDLVVETHKVSVDQVIRIKNKETVVLRNQIIPLIRMRHILEQPELENETELSVLVVKRYGQLNGLVIDEFLGKSEVILKPLEEPLASLKQYSGTALLGDGSVLLIFNLSELLK